MENFFNDNKCIHRRTKDSIHAMVGTDKKNEINQRIDIIDIIPHTQYEKDEDKPCINDMALLRVKPNPAESGSAKFIKFDTSTKAIELSKTEIKPKTPMDFSRFQ